MGINYSKVSDWVLQEDTFAPRSWGKPRPL